MSTPRLAEPNRYQSLSDIAEALQRAGVVVTRRMLDDASRTEPDLPLPPPMGMVGRARIWDALSAQAALPDLAAWFENAPARRNARHSETKAAQRAAYEAAFERRQKEIQAELAETAARYQSFRDSEAANKREADELAARHRGQRAIIPGER